MGNVPAGSPDIQILTAEAFGAKMYVEAIFSPLIIVGRVQARKILPATKRDSWLILVLSPNQHSSDR